MTGRESESGDKEKQMRSEETEQDLRRSEAEEGWNIKKQGEKLGCSLW